MIIRTISYKNVINLNVGRRVRNKYLFFFGFDVFRKTFFKNVLYIIYLLVPNYTLHPMTRIFYDGVRRGNSLAIINYRSPHFWRRNIYMRRYILYYSFSFALYYTAMTMSWNQISNVTKNWQPKIVDQNINL